MIVLCTVYLEILLVIVILIFVVFITKFLHLIDSYLSCEVHVFMWVSDYSFPITDICTS